MRMMISFMKFRKGPVAEFGLSFLNFVWQKNKQKLFLIFDIVVFDWLSHIRIIPGSMNHET